MNISLVIGGMSWWAGMSKKQLIICTYEDRLSAMVGVELLARSLKRFNPSWRLTVWSPHERELVTGLLEDEVDWRATTDLVGLGWNVKPTILLRALSEAQRAMWIDSDVIVVGPIDRALFADEQDLVVGQEFRDSGERGSEVRVRNWGWSLARTLPFHVNSGTIIVSQFHHLILKEWEMLLRSPEYLNAQALQPVTARPVHMLGDQDVLWALLCSRFASVPVTFLRNGVDVIQDSGANGFHVVDRVRNLLRNRIMFVHALGKIKPWQFVDKTEFKAAGISYMRWVTHEVSAYFIAASEYSNLISASWLHRRTVLAKVMAMTAGRGMAASGLPFAVVALVATSAIGRTRKRQYPRYLGHSINHS